jgi:alpha-L-fucosidase
MKKSIAGFIGFQMALSLALAPPAPAAAVARPRTAETAAMPGLETQAQHDARMQWWREARFGLFIHWGLYAVPAGEWGGKTGYGEWIRNNAQIPLPTYDKFAARFNPVKFDAAAWVKMAKDAGMKYIVITSKHHDGFAIFDSQVSDFDVMATPFRRDILKELAAACRREGIKLCFYHSIMDWHHPDYLPRRPWEVKDRPVKGADFERYVLYLKAQLQELLTNYGDLGVLWFDGEWEDTWNEARGRDLYDYVRSLQPKIIINNRVGASRSGMEGFSADKASAGDFGTPEQTIPATGLPGLDWETCMTMNDNWGYNKNDQAWKSSRDLIRKLADIASKGGNFLLNVGPTSEGLFPGPSVERLAAIGRWMKKNGEAIHGTQASPFKELAWGRATQKAVPGGTRVYLHVFDWPADGKLPVPGLLSDPRRTYLLADAGKTALSWARSEDAVILKVPAAVPDDTDTVIVMEFSGRPDVSEPPSIKAEAEIFLNDLDLSITSARDNVEIRYTIDGSVPSSASPQVQGPVRLTNSAIVTARAFRGGKPVSGPARAGFHKAELRRAAKDADTKPGLKYSYFEGVWDALPDFAKLRPLATGVASAIGLQPKKAPEHYGFELTGFLRVPRDGVYTLFLISDDGSRLFIGDTLVVDNDGLHSSLEKRGLIALAAGLHPIRVIQFNASGGEALAVSWQGPGWTKQAVPASALAHRD